MRALNAGRPGARALSARVLVSSVAQNLGAISAEHTDTGRYARAWVQAAKMAGVGGGLAAPTLRPSRWAKKMAQVLERQLKRAKRRLENAERCMRVWYEEPGANGKVRKKRGYYNTLSREIRKARKDVERAERELGRWKESGTAIVINMFGSGGKLVRAISKISGGVGTISDDNFKTTISMTNKEPHSRIVESRYKVLRRAEGTIRSVGIKRAGKKYWEQMQKAG